jgi:parallel beta-helix repeat protein
MHKGIALLALTFAFALMFSGAVTAANPTNALTNTTIQQNITHNPSTNQTATTPTTEIQTTTKSNINTLNNNNVADPYNNRTGKHYTTIQAAINSLYTHNGDTIDVTPGTYPENVVISKKLNIISTTPLEAKVYSFLVNAPGSGSSIIGFNITGGTGNGITLNNPENVTNGADNVTIKGNSISGGYDYGIYILASNYTQIKNNIINNNIFSYQLKNGTIIGNTITNASIRLVAPTSTLIENNNISLGGISETSALGTTIYHNTITGGGIGIEDGTNTLIDDNIIKDGAEGIGLNNVENLTIKNNNITNNIGDGIYLFNGVYSGTHANNLIFQNNITANNIGIELGASSSGNTIHFNRIVNNNQYGLVNSGSGVINATLNWWGYNNAAKVASQIHNNGTGSITYNPWIMLSIKAATNVINPSSYVIVGGTSTITADLLHDSNGVYHNPVNGAIPYTGSANFTTTKGTINNSNFTNGIATSILTNLSTAGVATVSANVDHQTVFTNVTVTGVTIKQLITAAANVKNYYELHDVLPSNVTISGQLITIPQFLQLLVTGTINISNGNLNPLTVVTVNPAPNPGGSFSAGNIYKSEYLTVAQNIKNFISTNGQAPNFATTSLGNIPYSKLVYMYSKIINYYANNKLPNYVSITP